MNIKEKNKQLKELIYHSLIPLIKTDYVLWDLPYHKNIGDLLIWQGELDFLKKIPYKMLNYASIATFKKPVLSKNTTILFHGGGNLGDVWRAYQEFKLQVIQEYPENPIVIFPQTVYYQDQNLLEKDAAIFNAHKKLTICVRDKRSFDILKKVYKGNLLLLPDMAFCIDISSYTRKSVPCENKTLYLKRDDRELKEYDLSFLKGKNFDEKDWPTFDNRENIHKILTVMQLVLPKKIFASWINYYAKEFHLPYCIKLGVNMVSKYNEIYTTRLHVGILSALLEKPFTYLDNSYGKNRFFYETWLFDVDEIKLIEK